MLALLGGLAALGAASLVHLLKPAFSPPVASALGALPLVAIYLLFATLLLRPVMNSRVRTASPLEARS
jgi:hypothetical protein